MCLRVEELVTVILSAPAILEGIEKRTIVIDPFDVKHLGPNSVNLTLHPELACYTELPLDMKKANPCHPLLIPDEGIILEPERLYLGRTDQYTETRGLVPMLEGRSSVGRLGMSVHITAGFGDVGFRGYWTLEISVLHPVRIYPHVAVCQIFYHQITTPHWEYKSKKYQDNRGLQPSLLHHDFGEE